MAPFVGRRVELGMLRACLEHARAGEPRVVLIEGSAGIGKTALLEEILVQAAVRSDVVVLRGSGEENEELLAYGVLRQLATSAGQAAAQAVPALDEPVAADAATLVDPITVGAGWLKFLDSMAGSTVVMAVDDAHWADRPSLQALVFALRRLVADRVMAVFATRDDGADGLPESLSKLITGHLGVVVRLSGLDEQELRDLAASIGVGGLPVGAARRLRRGTGGNPLHARALLEEFPVVDWAGQRRDEAPLPPPRSFRTVVGRRYDACRPGTRRLVDAVAVLGQHASVADAVSTAQSVDAPEPVDPVAAIDDATAHDLVRVRPEGTPWSLEFTHPLVRSAVYDAIGPARCHALHTAAARLSTDEAAALRHRVAAATGPDDDLAVELTAYAERAQRRLDWKSAAAHLVSASRLSRDPGEARRRVLWALVWTMLRGDAASAGDFADEVSSYPPGPLRDLVLGSLAMAAEEPERAGELLDRAWSACESVGPIGDSDITAAVALMRAIDRYGHLDAAGTVAWCERALSATGSRDTAGAEETSIHAVAMAYLVHGLSYSGRVDEALTAAGSADRTPDEARHRWLNAMSARGVLHMVNDELDSAAAVLGSVARTASRLGILNTSAFSDAYLARTQWIAGDWDDAQVTADRAVAVNLESDFGFLRSAVVGIAVLVPAPRGDWSAAEQYLRLLPPSQVRYERSIVALGMARARLADARGRPEEVLAALDPVRAFPERDAADEPGFWPWPDLYADALVDVGRVAEADEFLIRHEHLAADRGRVIAQARVARSRGRVEAAAGRLAAAEAAFDRALALIGSVRAPFERARIELAAGQVLRRAGHRRRAVELLRSARGIFAGLGAAAYAGRCDAELAAAGLATGEHFGGLRFGLTSQELVVARLVARGLTNREVAAELVISIKTVEYHLRNAFAKLGVTSRRQLPGRLAELPATAG